MEHTHLTEGLNPAQLEVVHYKEGPLLVLAGPGSGKTRVVTHRIAWLIEEGVAPWNIVALTFTNKAADEMKNRVAQLVPNRHVWIGTFHRFCARLLRGYAPMVGLNSNFTIYDMNESRQILDSLIERTALPNGVDNAKIASAISWAKNALILPENYQPKPGNLLGDVVLAVYPEYQQALQKANAVDFDDLLIHFAVLLREHPEVRHELDVRFQYILVDEYQDTNLVQYAIARALSQDYPNLCVTGDPDQSIYGWRGANIRNILEFERDFKNVKTIRLEENYRSTPNILAIASDLIEHNKLRKKKKLFTHNSPGGRPRVLICQDHHEEANSIAKEIAREIAIGKRTPGDYAIFYRMNALSRNLEHAFHQYNIPFQLVHGIEFFQRKEIRDIIAYLQLIYNPNDIVSFRRVINVPARGIGRTTMARLEEYAQLHNLTLWETTRIFSQTTPKKKLHRKRSTANSNQSEKSEDDFLPLEPVSSSIPSIPAKAKAALTHFLELLDRLRSMAEDSDLEVIVSLLIKETGYLSSIHNEGGEEEQQRLANVQELLTEVREFDNIYRQDNVINDYLIDPENQNNEDRLGRFLERTVLVNDVDDWKQDSDKVSLMTLHAAKGLEFPVVYIIALEEKILPHERSMNDKAQLEEERRLLFVGITRAREELRLSYTMFREYRGSFNVTITSRFLYEISKDNLQQVDSLGELEEGIQESPIPVLEPVSKRKTRKKKINDLSDEDANISLLHDPDSVTRKRSKDKKRPDPSEFDGIDEEVVYEEEVEIEYDDNGGTHQRPPQKKEKKKILPVLSPRDITIASDLVKNKAPEDNTANIPVSVRIGALVRHKDYGIGVVKELYGSKTDRMATVDFMSGVGQVDILLSDPKLTILQRRS